MLPFMNPKRVASSIASKKGKHEIEANLEVEAPSSNLDEALKDAAHELLEAIQSKSPLDLAKAFKSAFEACEKSPHEEGPHVESTK